jgi:hypothetical protein
MFFVRRVWPYVASNTEELHVIKDIAEEDASPGELSSKTMLKSASLTTEAFKRSTL